LGAVLALGGAVLAAHPASAVILDNGSVMIGIATDAELNDAGTMPSCGTGTYNVGIRFDATNCDGISPGCQCEGWGVAYTAGTTVKGYADISADGGAVLPCGGSSSFATDWATYDTVDTSVCN